MYKVSDFHNFWQLLPDDSKTIELFMRRRIFSGAEFDCESESAIIISILPKLTK